MDPSQYIYTRERRHFGRQCLFSDQNEILFSEPSNHDHFKDYILKNPVDRQTQLRKQMAYSELNTENVKYVRRGMNHTEGGWPKDVNNRDEEQTLRYRKKIERDDKWGPQVLELTKPMLNAVQQNSAVNIYQNYFDNLHKIAVPPKYEAHIVNVFRDEKIPTRPLVNLSWSPNNIGRIVASYAPTSLINSDVNMESFIWDIENPNKPVSILTPSSPATSIEWNMRDEHIIAGGFLSGLVGVWDPRVDTFPKLVSISEESHRERVNSLRWIQSKTNQEFFSGSSDGSLMWWDARMLNEPILKLLLDPEQTNSQIRSRSHGCSVLEYDFNIPTRFMAGTEQGHIFIGNRKGNDPSDMIVASFPIFNGPVYTLIRNPTYFKYFLAVGDWSGKICADESREHSILTTENHSNQLLCGTWSQTRSSLFIVGRTDGVIEFWDIILNQNKPILKMKICDSSILSIKGSMDGRNLAVGSAQGDIFMIQIEDPLTFNDRNERTQLAAIFEREVRRVKLLESRLKEVKLKFEADNETENIEVVPETNVDFSETEQKYFELIQKEKGRSKYQVPQEYIQDEKPELHEELGKMNEIENETVDNLNIGENKDTQD